MTTERPSPRPGTGAANDPWQTTGRHWALLDTGARSVDTQLEDPFWFIDGDDPPVVVGRSGRTPDEEACDLRARGDETISLRHCAVSYERGGWWVRDLASTNGTFVDGEPVPPDSPVRVHDGSAIRLGRELRFVLHTSESLVGGLCLDDATGLPHDRPFAQIVKRAFRRMPPVHVAFFSTSDGQNRDETTAMGSMLRALREVALAAPVRTGTVFVAHTKKPEAIAIVFRGSERDDVRAAVRRWHAHLDSTGVVAHACVVPVRNVHAPLVDLGRNALLTCALSGAGRRVFDQDVAIEWLRENEAALRERIARGERSWLAIGTPREPTATGVDHEEQARGSIARALSKLDDGSAVSIAWNRRLGVWLIAGTGDAGPLDAMTKAIEALRFVITKKASVEWLDERLAELAARRPIDVSRIAHPLVPLLSLSHVQEAPRMLQAAAHFERALRLAVALVVARVASIHDDQLTAPADDEPGSDLTPSIRALREARTRPDGLGTFVHLLRGMTAGLPAEEFPSLRKLLAGGWMDRAIATTQGRNVAVHSGNHDFGALATKLEACTRELVRSMVMPEVEILEVADVQPRRKGPTTVRFIRLVGPTLMAPETAERSGFVDQGTWFRLNATIWTRASPWIVRQRCPTCDVTDVFVTSPVTVHFDGPVRYLGTAHEHEFHSTLSGVDTDAPEAINLLRAAAELV